MPQQAIQKGCLVLYKVRPAIVTDIGEKITIQLEDNKAKRVRDKDIALLHPGPIKAVGDLASDSKPVASVSLEEAWELLEGETFSIGELTELLYDDNSPQQAWCAWQCVAEGVHFAGSPQQLVTRSRAEVDAMLEKLREQEAEAAEKVQFYDHIAGACLNDKDCKKLVEVERVALGTSEQSRILRSLDVKQTPESAHAFLVRCGYWKPHYNPYPLRNGIDLSQPEGQPPALADEPRRDLTHLAAYAIDDASSEDPDDAISLDGERLWVHVADVAALVAHDSELDMQARQRSANLYLPEGLVHMLPEVVTHQLGLGLAERSPALSIGFVLDQDNQLQDIEITPSWIAATRLSYEDADEQLNGQLADFHQLCERFHQHRLAQQAAEINLPEASLRVRDGEVQITPLTRGGSRQLVTDAMLMAGVAVAQFCQANELVIPFATQQPPESVQQPQSPSQMFAYRRQFKASRSGFEPAPHAGLGLPLYTRVTSPLRRYHDLAVHQQLRLFLTGGTPMTQEQMAEKLLNVDQQGALVRRTERQSNLHWKLVYLQQNPDWQGEAIVVDVDERKSTVIIPALALETKIRTRDSFQLDDTIRLQVSSVDLPGQTAFFQYLGCSVETQ